VQICRVSLNARNYSDLELTRLLLWCVAARVCDLQFPVRDQWPPAAASPSLRFHHWNRHFPRCRWAL